MMSTVWEGLRNYIFLCCENEHEITSLAKHQQSEAGSAGWPLPGKRGTSGGTADLNTPLALCLHAPSFPLPFLLTWPRSFSQSRCHLCSSVTSDPPPGPLGTGCWEAPSSYPLLSLPGERQAKSGNKALDATARSRVSGEQERSD